MCIRIVSTQRNKNRKNDVEVELHALHLPDCNRINPSILFGFRIYVLEHLWYLLTFDLDSGKLYCYGVLDSDGKAQQQQKAQKHHYTEPKRISEHFVTRIAKCGSTFVVFVTGMMRLNGPSSTHRAILSFLLHLPSLQTTTNIQFGNLFACHRL